MNENSVQKKKLPWTMIAILVITVLPIAGAYIAYFTGLGVSDTTVNEGVLIEANPPKSIQQLLEHASGELPSYERNYKWRLVIPIPEDCAEQCQQNLYTSRQVHIRLGEKAERVERYAVNVGGVSGEQFLESIEKEHPLLKPFTVSEAEWAEWIGGANVPADLDMTHYYLLIDQVGFAMMYYTAEHEGNQLLKDIKRILKYSIDK